MQLASKHAELPSQATETLRISSIDVLRGLIMVIMALDHVREFWSVTPYRAEDVSQTSVILFFTRWITHFCAPVFVFLSGISVFLYSRRHSRKEVSIFLLSRGLWLILLEIFVISIIMQWRYDMILLIVFWIFGWSMILLAGLIWLPRWCIAVIALLILAGHNLLPGNYPVTTANLLPALFYHAPFFLPLENLPPLLAAYTILPWFALMTAGYLVGKWFNDPVDKLNKRLLVAGFCLLGLFLLLRGINLYGDPSPWNVQPRGSIYTVLSFLNVTKYPPSLLFMCMTIGPAFLLLAFFNKYHGKIVLWFQTFGAVPFFFFLLHLILISCSALIWTLLRYNKAANFGFISVADWPQGYEPSLTRAYVVWIILITILYFPCKWFSNYRKHHKQWWLSYL